MAQTISDMESRLKDCWYLNLKSEGVIKNEFKRNRSKFCFELKSQLQRFDQDKACCGVHSYVPLRIMTKRPLCYMYLFRYLLYYRSHDLSIVIVRFKSSTFCLNDRLLVSTFEVENASNFSVALKSIRKGYKEYPGKQ